MHYRTDLKIHQQQTGCLCCCSHALHQLLGGDLHSSKDHLVPGYNNNKPRFTAELESLCFLLRQKSIGVVTRMHIKRLSSHSTGQLRLTKRYREKIKEHFSSSNCSMWKGICTITSHESQPAFTKANSNHLSTFHSRSGKQGTDMTPPPPNV